MIDIHTHVIPYVDDGSNSIDDSIEMITNEIKNGVTDIICTPHHIQHKYNKTVAEIESRFNELKREIEKRDLNINLYLGQEISCINGLKTIEMLNKRELLTINGSKYVLLEFSYKDKPADIVELIYNFNVNNYKVIIAHIERYEWLNIPLLKTLINEGCLTQINADSLFCKEGLKSYFFVKRALKKGLVNFIASDVHSFRKNYIKKAFNKYGKYLNVVSVL